MNPFRGPPRHAFLMRRCRWRRSPVAFLTANR